MKTFRPLQERPVIAMCASLQSHDCAQKPRNPKRAALLSLLPGAGQIYNGETGKGLLFLTIFAINVLLFVSLLLSGPVLGILGQLAAIVHWQIDPEALKWFSTVPAGSPFLFIYCCLILSFLAYAVREAYDRAALTEQGARHPKFFLGLPEATSGSYLFHFTVILCGVVLMLFMVVPKPPTEQITDIQLVPPPPAPKPAPPKPKEAPKPKVKTEEPKKPVEPQPVLPKPVEQKVVPQPTTEPTPVATAPAPQAPAAPASEGASAGGNGATGASSSGAGEAEDVDFGPYLAELQKRIKKNWFPPRGNESKRITVKFKIHQSGEITGVKLEKSSGLSIADDAAVEAIEKSSPLPPLPKGADAELVIKFTFDYNVFNGGSQSAAGSGAVSN